MKGKWCSRCGEICRLGDTDWMCSQCTFGTWGLLRWATATWSQEQWDKTYTKIQDEKLHHAEAVKHYLGDGNWLVGELPPPAAPRGSPPEPPSLEPHDRGEPRST